ncbi:MAG: 50S ribosomal protein L7ae [Candidatus Aenigmarchaeota archaeon]|nr:50S ribosomal protein L7ae [Candidatus Aenigmarchaeota archaeon]
MAEDVASRVLEAIEVARNSGGSIRKGANEVTKSLERQTAKLVAFAADVSPKEIVMHLPLLAKEKGIPCVEVKSREELGAAAGLAVPTTAVAVIAEGDAKNLIKEIKEELGA